MSVLKYVRNLGRKFLAHSVQLCCRINLSLSTFHSKSTTWSVRLRPARILQPLDSAKWQNPEWCFCYPRFTHLIQLPSSTSVVLCSCSSLLVSVVSWLSSDGLSFTVSLVVWLLESWAPFLRRAGVFFRLPQVAQLLRQHSMWKSYAVKPRSSRNFLPT